MNENINFIEAPPAAHMQSITRWYRWSLYAVASSVVLLMSINVYQWQRVKALGSPQQQLLHVSTNSDALSARIKKLTDAQEQLSTLNNKLHKQTLTGFRPTVYLSTIAHAIPNDTCIYTADLHKHGSLQLTGYTESAHSLQQFMQKLEASDYVSGLQLSSLQPENANQSTLYRYTLSAQLQSGPDTVE